MRTIPVLLLAAALAAVPGCHRSSRVELGNRLPDGSPAMTRTNLVYQVQRPDGSTYRAAFLRFAVGRPALSINFSDPEGETEDGVMVVAGSRPVVRSSRAVAIATGTIMVQASNANEDVIAVLEGGPAHVYARGKDGHRGRLIATLKAGEHVRVPADAPPTSAIATRSDDALSRQLADWRDRAERLWRPTSPAGSPPPRSEPDPDEPAPPIPPKPDQPGKPTSA
jgi:hypothetical protein